MNSSDIDQRPAKKRRFFFDDEPETPEGRPPPLQTPDASSRAPSIEGGSPTVTSSNAQAANPSNTFEPHTEVATECKNEFDVGFFTSVVGNDLSEDTIRMVRDMARGNMERAINIYFDGSWKKKIHRTDPVDSNILHSTVQPTLQTPLPLKPGVDSPLAEPPAEPPSGDNHLAEDPETRYIGAFGVGGWATRSGLKLISHGDEVRIERTKPQPTFKIGRGGRGASRSGTQRSDVITRFTNARGDEIGRLPRETAEWVSTLLDQKICKFTGVCVYAPDLIRVNDTVYIQIKCFLLRNSFRKAAFSSEDDDHVPRLFEQQETAEEKSLRLRQVALVTLFDEINLKPTSSNEISARHKKEGLLRAAEVAEQRGIKGLPSSTQSKEESSDTEEEERLDQDQLDSLYQKAQRFDFTMPEATPGEHFAMELRKYQKQALYWMLGKEKDMKSNRETSMNPLWEEYTWPVKDVDEKPLPRVLNRDKFYVNPYSGELSLEFPLQEQHCLGGILADEMGLGKTIEIMSLIHSHKPASVPPPSTFDPTSANALPALTNPPATKGTPCATLVVAPTSLLSQWESESMKASKPGSMKVLVYHGTEKSVDLRSLCSSTNPGGPINLIITSYGVVRSEYFQIASSRDRSAIGRTGLFSVEFFRLVLDEAHYIKNRASKTSRACCELKAIHRWALTGTPIVNRLEDLFSLVRYLKVEPWCNFSFWRTFITIPFESKDFIRALNVVQTVLEPLVLRRTKTMKTPEGEPLVPLPSRTIAIEHIELSDQERDIYDVIFTRAKRTFNDNVAAGTLLKSYTTIFAQLLRLRQTCCHPILTRNQSIVAEEEDAAIAAEDVNVLKDDMDLQELINQFTASTSSTNSEESQDPMAKFTTHSLKQIQTESSGECPICSEEPMIDPAVTSCWHSACKKCLETYIQHQADKGETPRCFSCRETLSIRDIFEVIRHKSSGQSSPKDDLYDSSPQSLSSGPRISLRRIHPLSPSARTSAKIHALILHLSSLPKNTKAVVFSQFTSFLDLIGAQLTREGIEHLRFDGSMQQKARKAILAQFNQMPEAFSEPEEDEDDNPMFLSTRSYKSNSKGNIEQPSPNVLLISLRAGGVGLNLTAANHVYMMDPWWSFAVEAQAIDRVHRMGQLKDVKVTRFVVKNSIEERMLRVQERKMMIAGSLGLRVGDASEEDRRKERIEELKLLFE
ncbi:SNF2 family N-terminal domain containing protein [Coccidioides posadasii C735 delta SOWgp]|uniref:SNF2 family N-terminal domain containing protein n=1 Tax=Coccidioides posadasii (strain C735) TaxID=222929 RepID=C5PDE2_COCP7|nr:SNF2 family N-terminal domain containing protein [Coccidioides posadasii C735 delta SOWgp]EER25103.1 SNF2 family N-terminal domain containing protein [Coccidioides posadasii C735 delta SOWgp]|eukprot:XP_003067248.1 SNF2 family N-terminal domain containing protein [Coccidioides posadasii C735 delta SOWgp]